MVKNLPPNAGHPVLIPGWGRSPGEGNGYPLQYSYVFPDGSDGEESSCDVGDSGSIPELGRFPGEGNGYPLQYSCLENSIDRGTCGLQSMGLQRVRHDGGAN